MEITDILDDARISSSSCQVLCDIARTIVGLAAQPAAAEFTPGSLGQVTRVLRPYYATLLKSVADETGAPGGFQFSLLTVFHHWLAGWMAKVRYCRLFPLCVRDFQRGEFLLFRIFSPVSPALPVSCDKCPGVHSVERDQRRSHLRDVVSSSSEQYCEAGLFFQVSSSQLPGLPGPFV